MNSRQLRNKLALEFLKLLVAITCSLVGGTGVVLLFLWQGVEDISAICLIVVGLAALPGLIVRAFRHVSAHAGRCLGLAWRTLASRPQ